jgi:FdhD protein
MIIHQKIRKYLNNSMQEVSDIIAIEAPVTIYLNDEEVVTLLCTPEYLEELAVGFLVAEGLISKSTEISTQVDGEKGLVWVNAEKVSRLGKLNFAKRMITTGCGKGTSLYHFHGRKKPVQSKLQVSIDILFNGLKKMHANSDLYKSTGGVHSSALLDTFGIIKAFREDVGRHNAADKILGYCIKQNIILEDKVFLTSGRISSEIIGKVAQMEIPIVVSRTAPTSLAINMASELGITIVGFMRGKRANIYTYPDRIIIN